jgi:hypothetical protein
MSRIEKIANYTRLTKAPLVKSASIIKNAGLRHHVESQTPISDNIYRFGSAAYFELITEAREHWLSGMMKFCEEDVDLLSSDLGHF